MEQLDDDSFGREVYLSTDGTTDTYTVGEGAFTVTFGAGTPPSQAYGTIDAMGPP